MGEIPRCCRAVSFGSSSVSPGRPSTAPASIRASRWSRSEKEEPAGVVESFTPSTVEIRGFHHNGLAIDERGDVHAFWGGPVFSGTSAHELAVLLRHGKEYVGTLQPADSIGWSR